MWEISNNRLYFHTHTPLSFAFTAIFNSTNPSVLIVYSLSFKSCLSSGYTKIALAFSCVKSTALVIGNIVWMRLQ